MIDFKSIYFGCADATTEASREPKTFKKVFFDPNNYLNSLVNGPYYILRGRKGDGKSAYGAQICLSKDDYGIFPCTKTLSNFNNEVFTNIKTSVPLGGNSYISFWKCILSIEYVLMLHEYEPNIQVQSFVEIVDALSQYGFVSKDNDIAMTVKRLVETDTTIDIKSFFKHSRKNNFDTTLKGATDIYNAIKESIKNIYTHQKYILIIDGLDDLLINSEFNPKIITGLIRATEDVNREFAHETLLIKTLILIRDDILSLCRDPNLSKIVRDSGIRLSWEIQNDPFDSDLVRLVEKRVKEASNDTYSFREMWTEVFPETINGKNALDYVLDNIIYRPRDILQFFIEAQREFVSNKRLTEEKVRTALVRYSEEYFIDAMRDELTGFFPDDVATKLPEILSGLGARYFYLEDFERECNKYRMFQEVDATQILNRLFEAGYIGQKRVRDRFDFTVFSYRNPHEKFQPADECIVHRGLVRALTL